MLNKDDGAAKVLSAADAASSNKSLKLTANPLRSLAAGELRRSLLKMP